MKHIKKNLTHKKTINMILYNITFGLCFSLILCLSVKILQERIKEY